MENSNVMVCVTQQRTCERLILSGYDLIKSQNDKLYVIHVVNEKEKFLDYVNDGEALEYLFSVSKKVGADLTVLRSKDVMQAMIDFAQNNEITHIIIGTSVGKKKIEGPTLGLKLKTALPEVELIEL